MARSRSRRSTPSSPPKPAAPLARTLRKSGRNQESESHSAQPNLRSSSVESSGVSPKRTRAAKGKTKARIEQELPAVQEHGEVEYPALQQSQGPIDLQNDNADSDIEVDLEIRSAYSDGTTHTAAEREALKFEELVDELSTLVLASSKLLSMFDLTDSESIINLHVQLRIPASQESHRLHKLLDKFQQVRSLFGTSGYLINQSIVIQVLCRVNSWSEVGNGLWRPDCIFQLANLAEIMSVLFPSHRESQSVEDSLAHLQHNFPSSFMNDLGRTARYADIPGLSRLERETIELALDLRTHYVIKMLIEHKSDASFDPDDITRLIFYSNGERFRGWDVDSLQDEDGNAPRQLETMIQARVEALREYFSPDPTESVDFTGLNEAFPWTDMLTKFCQWARLRSQELKEEIRVRGGPDKIEERFWKGELAGITPARESHGPVMPAGNPLGSPRRLQPSAAIKRSSAILNKRTSLDNAYRLRELENATGELQFGGHDQRTRHVTVEATPRTVSPQDQDDGLATFGDDATIVPTQTSVASPRKTQMLMNHLSAHRKESNKENINEEPNARQRQAFIDRQAGAHRIDFDSQEPEAEPSTKRPRKPVQAVDEDDEDDGFEADTRPEKIQRRQVARQRLPSTTVQPDVPDETISLNFEEEEEAQPVNRDEAQDTAERVPADRRESQTQRISRAESYQTINQAAKISMKTTLRRPVFPQARTPYSTAEVDRIIELVEKYGISYSLIKTMDERHPLGPELTLRSQVDIKDKCRNMVMDFLKSRVRLPVNFEMVPLKTKDKQTLRRLGIEV